MRARLQLDAIQHGQRVGREAGDEVLAVRHVVRILGTEQTIIEAHLGGYSVIGAYPMDGAAHFAAVRRVAAPGFRVVCAVQGDDLAKVILDDLLTADEESPTEAHLAAGRHAEEFPGRVLHEIVPFDKQISAERDQALAGALILRVVYGLQPFGLAFGKVRDHDRQGIEYTHNAHGSAVQLLANEVLQQFYLQGAVGAGDANVLTKIAQRLGRHASPPLTGERRHARVVPAVYVAFFDKTHETPLARHHVRKLQSGELDLARMVDPQRVQVPVVQGAVVHVFQRAKGVGDAFDRVGLAMCPIVHRVDAPRIAGALVGCMANAVHHGVPQIDVGRTHVDLGSQDPCAVGKFAGLHSLEQIQVFGNGPIAIGAVTARLG